MDFELTSEHLMLKESAASFVKKDHSFKRLRELKDDEWGYSKEVWDKMAELGWMALIYPEKYGGLELEFSFSVGLLEMVKGLLSIFPFTISLINIYCPALYSKPGGLLNLKLLTSDVRVMISVIATSNFICSILLSFPL